MQKVEEVLGTYLKHPSKAHLCLAHEQSWELRRAISGETIMSRHCEKPQSISIPCGIASVVASRDFVLRLNFRSSDSVISLWWLEGLILSSSRLLFVRNLEDKAAQPRHVTVLNNIDRGATGQKMLIAANNRGRLIKEPTRNKIITFAANKRKSYDCVLKTSHWMILWRSLIYRSPVLSSPSREVMEPQWLYSFIAPLSAP